MVMKLARLAVLGIVMVMFVIHIPSAYAENTTGDFFRNIFGSSGGKLSDSKIIRGLKEALEIGTGNAVDLVSKLDGYYKNPNIKIPLPKAVQKVETVMVAMGYGPQVEEFSRTMNRAAERAAPEAKALFWDAVKAMTFDDARKILNGKDNEATLYFEDKTRGRLHQLFMPVVHATMEAIGVTRTYQEVHAKLSTIPFADRLNLDLDKYVTDKALDGLFYLVAEEERKIRKDPAARVTKLLKDVFGNKGQE
jgi:hypothetical protein